MVLPTNPGCCLSGTLVLCNPLFLCELFCCRYSVKILVMPAGVFGAGKKFCFFLIKGLCWLDVVGSVRASV
jgi:hypothetical protein